MQIMEQTRKKTNFYSQIVWKIGSKMRLRAYYSTYLSLSVYNCMFAISPICCIYHWWNKISQVKITKISTRSKYNWTQWTRFFVRLFFYLKILFIWFLCFCVFLSNFFNWKPHHKKCVTRNYLHNVGRALPGTPSLLHSCVQFFFLLRVTHICNKHIRRKNDKMKM